MIQVRLSRGTDGELTACSAAGHAGYAQKGSDIVCAGVSVLIRTTLALLEKQPGIVLKMEENMQRGQVAFRVAEKTDCESVRILKYAADFLEEGLSALCKDYPEYVNLAEA